MLAILLQSVLVPIVLSPVAYALGKRYGSKAGWFSFVVLLYSTALLIAGGASSTSLVETYFWKPIGFFGLRLDGLSLPFAITVALLGTILAVYSMPYMAHRMEDELAGAGGEHRKEEENSGFGSYYLNYLLYVSGMLGTVLATNLIQFYIFFELMLVPSFFLIAQFGYGERERISLMYFLWTHLGGLLLLAGLLSSGFLSSPGPSFDMVSPEGKEINLSKLPPGLALWIAASLTVGLFVKLAAVGLHIWLPHAHAEAPTPISALLSPAMIGIGGYALIRFFAFIMPTAFQTLAFGVGIWGLLTMIYGGAMALAQDDVKRLFAYSSVSQMGYIIFGIGSAQLVGVSGSIFHYVSHGTGKGILFMVAGSIMLQTGGLRSMSKLGGLAPRMPITALAAMIGFLTIMGVPPTNGFQSEWMIFFGALSGASQPLSASRMAMAVTAVLATALTFGYALNAMRRLFFGRLPEELNDVHEAVPMITAPLIFLAVFSMVVGIYPTLLTDRIVPLMREVIR